MENVVNLGMPHVSENIFQSIDTPGLINCLEVSQTWNELAGNVLIKRWKGKMFEACKSGETKIVQLLLERSNAEESGLNIKDRNGITPFMWACRNGHVDVVKLLLDHTDPIIELNERSNGPNERNNGEETLKIGLPPPLDLELLSFKMTVFMFACEKGHKDVVQLLLHHSNRIDLNAVDSFEETAFMIACSNGHKDVVKLLLDQSDSIELNARNIHGYNAFMRACENGNKNVVKLLLDHSDSIELNARILFPLFPPATPSFFRNILADVLISIYGYDGTAFSLACYNRHIHVVQLLLEHSDPNARDNLEQTELMMIASQFGLQDSVQ